MHNGKLGGTQRVLYCSMTEAKYNQLLGVITYHIETIYPILKENNKTEEKTYLHTHITTQE